MKYLETDDTYIKDYSELTPMELKSVLEYIVNQPNPWGEYGKQVREDANELCFELFGGNDYIIRVDEMSFFSNTDTKPSFKKGTWSINESYLEDFPVFKGHGYTARCEFYMDYRDPYELYRINELCTINIEFDELSPIEFFTYTIPPTNNDKLRNDMLMEEFVNRGDVPYNLFDDVDWNAVKRYAVPIIKEVIKELDEFLYAYIELWDRMHSILYTTNRKDVLGYISNKQWTYEFDEIGHCVNIYYD